MGVMDDQAVAAVLAARIAERLQALGLSERKASLDATGQPDAIRFIRTRGTMPSASRLMKLAKTLEATPAYLTGRVETNDWEGERRVIQLAASIDENATKQFSSGRVVPVVATNAMNDSGPLNRGDVSTDLTVYSFKEEILAFAAPPLGMEGKQLGAFYPADTTMSPVFDPAVPVVFVHGEEAVIGGYGLVFIQGDQSRKGEQSPIFVLRRIVDRGDDWVTVEQHTPPEKRRLADGFVVRTRRVLSLRDYVMPPSAVK